MVARPMKSQAEIQLNNARSTPILRRVALKEREPNVYVIELYAPPYPQHGKHLKVHKKDLKWTVDRLSSTMITTWTVKAYSKSQALAELVTHLRRFEQ